MKQILVVEDEEQLRNEYVQALRGQGFDVLEAADGLDGVSVAKAHKPTVIILDLILPKKHGFDVLKELRQDKALNNTSVVILSNLAGEGNKAKAGELGADEFFVKTPDVIKKVMDWFQAKGIAS